MSSSVVVWCGEHSRMSSLAGVPDRGAPQSPHRRSPRCAVSSAASSLHDMDSLEATAKTAKETNVMSQSPTVSRSVIAKLLFFSAAMLILPLSAYYLSLEYLFSGYKTNYAAITAAITANLVVAGYVVVAFLEDDTGEIKLEQATKKMQ